MTASSLYNMIDSIYIGQGVGPMAISGLAVTFPLMNLSTAFGTLVGAGAATILSIFLGRKKYSACNKVLSNVVSLNIIIGLLFMAVSLIFIDPILYFFGASENTLPYAKEYMTIILYGNIITHLYFGLNAAMRSTGDPKKAMGLTIFTVILNAILDPIFIFALDMGIAGAAWATVISQSVSLVIVMLHFSNHNRAVHFKKGILRLNFKVAKESLAIGSGPFLMNAAACLVTLFINQQLRSYSGDLGIGAYGICNRIVFMFIMICMGLNQGMQPIAGYNYGARQYSRVKQVFWKTAMSATVVTMICFLISMFIPRAATGIFTSNSWSRSSYRGISDDHDKLLPVIGNDKTFCSSFTLKTDNLPYTCIVSPSALDRGRGNLAELSCVRRSIIPSKCNNAQKSVQEIQHP